MAGLSETLSILITANGAQASREFQKVGTAANRSLVTAESKAQVLGSTLTKVGVGLLTFGGVAAAGLFKAAQSASNLEQATGAVEAVLPGAAAGVEAWSQTTAEAFGLSERAAKESVAQIAAQLKGMGIAEGEAAQQAQLLTERAADLAATFGGPVEEAVVAVSAVLRGERDPIERYGVSMKQTDINARVMADGLDTSSVAAKKHSEAQAALSILLEQTSDSAGQFGRESETMAGQMAIMQAKGEDMAAAIGQEAAPAFADLMDVATGVADAFGQLPEGVQSTISTLLVFGTATATVVGGVSLVSGQLMRLVPNVRLAGGAVDGLRLKLMMMSTVTKGAVVGGLAAAAVGLSIYLSKQAQAEAMVDKFADALRDQADASGLALDQAVANTVATDSMLSKYEDFGLSATEVATAVRDGGDALETVLGKLAEYEEASRRAGEGHAEFQSKAFAAALREESGALEEARGQVELEREAQEGLNAAMAEGAERTAMQAEQVGILVDEIKSYLELTQGVEEAQLTAIESQNEFFESLLAGAQNFNEMDAAGRRNIETSNEYVGAVAAQVEAIARNADQTGNYAQAQRDADAAVNTAIGNLARARDQGLITQDQFNKLATEMDGIPRNININTTSNVGGVLTQFQQLPAAIRAAAAAADAAQANAARARAATGNAHGGFLRPGESAQLHADEFITNRGGVLEVTSQSRSRSMIDQGTAPGMNGRGGGGRPVENVIVLDGKTLAKQMSPHLRAVTREDL